MNIHAVFILLARLLLWGGLLLILPLIVAIYYGCLLYTSDAADEAGMV